MGPTSTRAPVDAIVLAAGASSRMGRAKARLVWRDRSFVQHCIELARVAEAREILVVRGAESFADLELHPAREVPHLGWELGPFSSLQAGLRARTDTSAPLLLLTVDRPHLRPTSVMTLVDAARREPERLWQASYAGRRGHPLVWPPLLCAAALSADPRTDRRDFVRAWRREHGGQEVACEDPAVLENIDDPERLAALLARA